MKCKICGCEDVKIIYHGPIKTGLLDGYTKKAWDVYQCQECKVIWNLAQTEETSEFYESEEYRKRIEGNSYISTYYEKHDKEVLDKLEMTGTDLFRERTVADIGCAGGSFLDFVSGAAKEIVAIEPSRTYQKALKEKGYHAYQYASEALKEWRGKCDVVTSFDVIEHVEDPASFAKEVFELLKDGGKAIIGTPTDYPILREMLGNLFDKFIFQVQHPWVLSKESLEKIFYAAGFHNIKIEIKQKYGLGNLLAWLHEEKPRGDIKFDFISDTLDAAYKKEMGKMGGEYLIVYATKGKTE